MRLYLLFYLLNVIRFVCLPGKRGHGGASEAAGVDPAERGKISVYIEPKAVKGNAMADGDANTAHFLVTNPYAVVTLVAACDDATFPGGAKHYFFKQVDIIADRELELTQTEDGVEDNLAWTVVGNIPSSLDGDQVNAFISEECLRYHQVVLSTPLAQSVDRCVL